MKPVNLDISHVIEMLVTLSREMERVTLNVDYIRKKVEDNSAKIEKIHENTIKQDFIIGFITKLSKMKPLYFIIGGVFTGFFYMASRLVI